MYQEVGGQTCQGVYLRMGRDSKSLKPANKDPLPQRSQDRECQEPWLEGCAKLDT